MQRLLVIVDEWADVMRRLELAADLVAVEMRALGLTVDEMKVRALALALSTTPLPALVATCHASVGLTQSPTYFADGADLEYG